MNEISSKTLVPSLLVSMPQLNDPEFCRTVVLLCEYRNEGAFGLILNRDTQILVADVIDFEPPINNRGQDALKLWHGGPVEPQSAWILMGQEPEDENSIRLCEGVYLSTSIHLLRTLVEDCSPPGTRLISGHAGWEAGQLEAELANSAWLIADIDKEVLFNTCSSKMWKTVIRRLGVEPALLQMGGKQTH
tara:strand:+ start:82 stop:651 length:570 start_codon:yes stop_codon:yes gene_type:complete